MSDTSPYDPCGNDSMSSGSDTELSEEYAGEESSEASSPEGSEAEEVEDFDGEPEITQENADELLAQLTANPIQGTFAHALFHEVPRPRLSNTRVKKHASVQEGTTRTEEAE